MRISIVKNGGDAASLRKILLGMLVVYVLHCSNVLLWGRTWINLGILSWIVGIMDPIIPFWRFLVSWV